MREAEPKESQLEEDSPPHNALIPALAAPRFQLLMITSTLQAAVKDQRMVAETSFNPSKILCVLHAAHLFRTEWLVDDFLRAEQDHGRLHIFFVREVRHTYCHVAMIPRV
jgi:hypothetical protein